jgi:hypothetical protein
MTFPKQEPLALEAVRACVADAVNPGRFFVSGSLTLHWEHVAAEEVSWEIFHGRLLDATQTRERQTFEAWNIYRTDAGSCSAEPLLSVKLDVNRGQLHVVRAVLSYAWEGYHAGDNVYLTRETTKWLRELVGTVDLQGLSEGDFRELLGRRLFQAAVGVSRLPLTSIEAPLPEFTLGELGYFVPTDSASEPMRSPLELIDRALTPELPWAWKARLLELVLRATTVAELDEIVEAFVKRWQTLSHAPDQLAALLRTLFEDVALSPYTGFVDSTLTFIDHVDRRGYWTVEQYVDFLSGLLRQLARHLTAFDLVTFHHRGANYPDALLLDAALTAYLALVERRPDLFTCAEGEDMAALRRCRLRRRALRQACLLRCWYEGHPVPDLPTSPGENSRVLPSHFPRVPVEQIADPSKRRKRLFDGDPLLPKLKPCQCDVLFHSLRDLDKDAELQEFGVALFLDRPLGVGMRPGEPDPSPLLSYEAFSTTIAARRLQFMEERFAGRTEPCPWTNWRKRLEALTIHGLPLQVSAGATRPGVASLADAFRVAPDFVLLRSTRRSIREFLASEEFHRLQVDDLGSEEPRLIVAGAAVGASPRHLLIYHGALRMPRAVEIFPTEAASAR